jgi:hypothetical protein
MAKAPPKYFAEAQTATGAWVPFAGPVVSTEEATKAIRAFVEEQKEIRAGIAFRVVRLTKVMMTKQQQSPVKLSSAELELPEPPKTVKFNTPPPEVERDQTQPQQPEQEQPPAAEEVTLPVDTPPVQPNF